MQRNFIRTLCWILTVALAGANARAQGVAAPSATAASQPHPSDASPAYTLRTRVPLTIVDVVVTDAKGNPVHGLHQSDFSLFEDNKPVEPNSFEEHTASEPHSQAAATSPALPANTFTNSTPAAPATGPLVVLLFDPLNMTPADQLIVRKRMLETIDKVPAGTRIAVFNQYSHLSIVQGFTTDRALLRTAVESKKTPPTISSIPDPFEGSDTVDPAADDQPPYQVVDRQAETSALRAQYELAGLNQIARYFSGIPGRKNLIWFTGSFPLQFPPVQNDAAFPPNPCEHNSIRGQSYDFEPQMKAALDLLARAHVAVFPIDGRGLQVPPMPSTFTPASPPKSKVCPPPASPKMPGTITPFQVEDTKATVISEHFTMDIIAEQTGGKAFYNTNGFAESVKQAIDLGSNFYTLTYTSPNVALDTRFRTIKVKIARPNLHLDYRSGYYALDPGISLSGVKVPHATAFQAAMLHGAPDLTEILFKVAAARLPAADASLLVDNHRSSDELKPPFRRYNLSYTTDIHNIAFTRGADGNYTADFEYEVALISAATGQTINSANREVRPLIPDSTYQSMLNDGALATQQIDVPSKGEFFLRLSVHDILSDRVGAVEIPLSAVRP